MSSEINYTLKPTDIEWEMSWDDKNPDGSRKYPDKPETEIVFEQEKAVAHLLINDVIFINSHHYEKDWPEKARKSTAILVNCNDIFAWGCADAEEASVKDIEDLYRMWKDGKYHGWGSAMWCMKKRREMPQTPVDEAMRESGVDLDAFQKEYNIRENFGNGLSRALKEAGVACGDEGWKPVREKFIKENGWEGNAE